MIKQKYLLPVLLILILGISCSAREEEKKEAKTLKPKDYIGLYTGTFPCEKCGGIKVAVVLDSAKVARIHEVHSSEKKYIKDYKGDFTISHDTLTFWGAPNSLIDSLTYLVEENRLVRINPDRGGEPLELASQFLLTRIDKEVMQEVTAKKFVAEDSTEILVKFMGEVFLDDYLRVETPDSVYFFLRETTDTTEMFPKHYSTGDLSLSILNENDSVVWTEKNKQSILYMFSQ